MSLLRLLTVAMSVRSAHATLAQRSHNARTTLAQRAHGQPSRKDYSRIIYIAV